MSLFDPNKAVMSFGGTKIVGGPAQQQFTPGLPKTPWTWQEAIQFICQIQPVVYAVGWNTGITGGVLYRGKSDKDLDVIFYPHNSDETSEVDDLHRALIAFGLTMLCDEPTMKSRWTAAHYNSGSCDQKHVEVWDWNGKRIDAIILR